MAVTEIDAYGRQQAYLEGYKNGQEQEIDPLFEEIAALILLLLMRTPYDNLGQMPKAALRKFVAELNRKLAAKFTAFNKLTMAQMQKFMGVAVTVNRAIATHFRAKPAPLPNNGKLWARIAGAPIPGAGIEGGRIIRDYFSSVKNQIERLFKRGYAEGWTREQFMKELVGTKGAKFRDGLVNKMRNQYSSAIQTLIQYVQQSVVAFIGSIITDRYRWVSVIDSATTDICRGRNGNVYEWATGPRPPAHYRCRSTIVPVFDEATEPAPVPRYYVWIRAQPPTVQEDIIGKGRAVALRNGELSAKDLPNFDGMRPLTLEDYKDRSKKLLTN